mmetsp:Transcript_14332/g.43282  ORF Transcript_14332/g.43282 Transcript_14332/m.43282 type:complete len:229 (-) Transcript_14332:169-855(-)
MRRCRSAKAHNTGGRPIAAMAATSAKIKFASRRSPAAAAPGAEAASTAANAASLPVSGGDSLVWDPRNGAHNSTTEAAEAGSDPQSPPCKRSARAYPYRTWNTRHLIRGDGLQLAVGGSFGTGTSGGSGRIGRSSVVEASDASSDSALRPCVRVVDGAFGAGGPAPGPDLAADSVDNGALLCTAVASLPSLSRSFSTARGAVPCSVSRSAAASGVCHQGCQRFSTFCA